MTPADRVQERGDQLLIDLATLIGSDHPVFHETAHILLFAMGHLELGETA